MPPLLEILLITQLALLLLLAIASAAGLPIAKRFWPHFLRPVALTSADTSKPAPRASTTSAAKLSQPAAKKPSGPVQLVVVVRDGMPADRVAGFAAGTLQVDTTTPADAGPTNKLLLELLSASLGLPTNAIGLVKGHYQARKTVQVTGLSLEDIQAKLSGPRL